MAKSRCEKTKRAGVDEVDKMRDTVELSESEYPV